MKPKGDIPHLRYLFDKQTHFQYLRAMKTLANSFKFADSDAGEFRLRVLEYYTRWGLRPTLDAFNVKKSTFYDWRKAYEVSGKKLGSLIPCSTRPHHCRQMATDYRLIACIKALRHEYGNMGSHQLKPFVDSFAQEKGIASISIGTIEKVIKRYHLTFESRRKVARKFKLKRLRSRYAPKVREPGFIQMDSITAIINEVRYHFMSVIDIYTKFAYVTLVHRQQAKYAVMTLKTFCELSPNKIHTVQTDNGSEFLAEFHDYLDEQGLKHLFIYPHSPRINGVVERFNKTVQEECILRADEISVDLDAFQGRLTKYLSWYNTMRPHAALHYLAPLQFINQIPKSL